MDSKHPPMRWTMRIASWFGIGIYVHATFPLIVAWVALAHYLADRPPDDIAASIVFIPALFFCIVLHEYGHALVARSHGIGTADITLLPIGGVARLTKEIRNPVAELWIALAGPAVSITVAAALFSGIALTGMEFEIEPYITFQTLPAHLMATNILIVIFNMIPAFPMDGGRVLRALMSMVMGQDWATLISSYVAQAFAVFFFIGGYMIGNPGISIIGVLLFFDALSTRSTIRTADRNTYELLRWIKEHMDKLHSMHLASGSSSNCLILIIAKSEDDEPFLRASSKMLAEKISGPPGEFEALVVDDVSSWKDAEKVFPLSWAEIGQSNWQGKLS